MHSPTELVTPAEIEATFRRVFWLIIPLLVLCYIIAFVDRANVGFAKLQFMGDLGFSEAVFGLGGGLFYLGYSLFEVPSNLIMEKVGARRWIARILITWGIISGFTAAVSGTWSFLAIRFLLGQGRSWKMGPIFNGTAVTAQSTVDTNIASHAAYVTQQGTRPRMVYVGDDMGTLHAFYLESGTWGGAGQEAWAYVPPEMFPLLIKLSAQNGQPLDPTKH